ncbi:MAG: putative quinol monooxygenase [Pseudomonadota bacterium]
MFAVVVTFTLSDGTEADFLPLVESNARLSLDQEPGCHRFDVCTDPGRPGEVFLYELYTDEAAFAEHLKSNHFLEFDAAASAYVTGKDVRTFTRVVS